jgi:hypothetical protein
VEALDELVMRIVSKASAAAALALLLSVVAAAFLVETGEPRVVAPSDRIAAASPATSGGMPCLYHVMIIHDVHWATACMKNDPPDNGVDCMLPPERAAVLNRAQLDAEDACRRGGR